MKRITKILLCLVLIFVMLGNMCLIFSAEQTEDISAETAAETADDVAGGETAAADEPSGTVIWVQPGGGGNGSKDKPLGSIEAAKSMVSGLSAAQRAGGVTVMLREGEYALKSPLEFKKSDSGAEGAPIVYAAYNGEKVVIHGGEDIEPTEFKKVGDKNILAKLDPSVRDSVVVADLKKSRFSDLGKNYCNFEGSSRAGFSSGEDSNTIMLFYKDSIMQNSVYPNEGEKFARSQAVREEDRLRFYVDETEKDKMAQWEKTDLRDAVLGYINKPGYNWYVSSMEGTSIDSKTNSVLMPPKSFAEGDSVSWPNNMARYWVFNLIDEIDMPGEWAIDYANKKLYFLPPGGKMQKVRISMVDKPLINLKEASNITFKGLTVGYARNNGFNLENCKNIVIDGCTVEGAGKHGVYITGAECLNNTVKNSVIKDIGVNGVFIENAGRADKKYVPCENKVESCEIFNVAKFAKMGYGVAINGAPGTRILKNRIHNTPSVAIDLRYGMGSTIDYNEIYDVMREMLDLGAIYAPSAMSWGTSISHNYIHDVIRYTPQGSPVNGIYLDDWGCGYICEGNIIKNVTTYGFHCNGSNSNSIHDNIIIGAGTPIHVRDYSLTDWIAKNPSVLANKIGWPSESYKSLFPSLEGYFEGLNTEYSFYCLPRNNEIYNNIAVACQNGWGMDANTEVYSKKFENNLIYKNEKEAFDFKNSEDFDMTFSKDSPIYETVKNFEDIDFSEMGISAVKELTAPELFAPADGAKNIDVNTSALSWNGGTHNKFRIIAALDESFDSVVLDKTVVGTRYTPEVFKYGNVKYFWKVIPVRESKADNSAYVESEVHSFTSKGEEKLDKSVLSRVVRDIGSGFKSFDGYSEEAIAAASKAYDRAKLILSSESVRQRDVRSAAIELQNARDGLYESLSTNIINIDSLVKDVDNWKMPEGSTVDGKEVMFPQNAPTRYGAYAGRSFQCGETLRFKGIVNFTNWQGFGFWGNTDLRFENSPSLMIVMRASGFEVQRRNYDEEGKISGGVVANFENNGDVRSGEVMDFELGINEVHNGILFSMKVNGKTVVDYLDKTDLAVTEGVYFGMHDGSFSPIGVMPVNE